MTGPARSSVDLERHAFSVVACDIPEGMTLGEYRRERAKARAERRRATSRKRTPRGRRQHTSDRREP